MSDIVRRDQIGGDIVHVDGQMSEDGGGTKSCPACAETIKLAAKKCRFCNEYLDGSTPTGNLQPQVVVHNVISNANTAELEKISSKPIKSRVVAAALAFLLGGLGFHRFYMGHAGRGCLYFLMCWTFIPMVIAFFECFSFLSYKSDEDFTERACY